MRAAELDEGTEYAFRPGARSTKPFERVTLLDALPAGGRVGVRFETGDRADHEGTATLAQLIVPWSEVERLEEALCELADFDHEPLTQQELAFETRDGDWVLPMGACEELARSAVQRRSRRDP